MAFLSSIDVTVPTEGTSTVASLNDAQRAHRAATKGTIEVQHDLTDGRHKIPTGNLSAKPSVQVGDFYLATDKGQLVIGKDGSNWTLGGDLQYGTRISIVQATVPSGFTIVTGFDDKVFVGEDTTGQGGDTAGSWTISGITVDAHTHTTTATGTNATTGAHTHTVASHTHTITRVSDHKPSAGTNYGVEVGVTGSTSPGTDSQGNHTHTFTGNAVASLAASATGITSDGTWRPAYVKVLVVSKDTTVS